MIRVPTPEGHNDTTAKFHRQSLECGYKTFEESHAGMSRWDIVLTALGVVGVIVGVVVVGAKLLGYIE